MRNIVRIPALVIIFTIGFFIINNYGQNVNSKDILEKGKSELLKTELEFYNATQQKGWGQAFIDFADDGSVLLRQDQFPIIGKANIIDLYKDKESNVLPIKWTPVNAEVSNDGSLGYTYGNWTYTSGKEEITYGNYVTIWKKHPDGKWKFLLDGGNTIPAPEK